MKDQIRHISEIPWKAEEIGKSKELVGWDLTATSALRLFSLAPGEVFASHEHEFLQCMYFISGKGTVSLDEHQQLASPGLCVTVLPQQWHSVENTGDIALEILVFESIKMQSQDTPFVDF